MTKENVDIKFEKVVAESISEESRLVSFDFVVDVAADFITDYFDTVEEFYENFYLVFSNISNTKTARKEKMPKWSLMSTEDGNFYRSLFKYDYLLPTNTTSYKLSYHYEVSLADLRQKYGYSLTEPPDVVSAESRAVPIFEAGEFQGLVQDLTGLQTFGKLERFVAEPKLTDVLQIDKILYKTAKSDNWHSEFMSTRNEGKNYLFFCIVDAEKFMSANYRLDTLISDKLSATVQILNVYATSVGSGMVLSVAKTKLDAKKLLITVKATVPKIKVTFAFKDNSKERAQTILNAISVGPEAALQLDDLSKFIDNKLADAIKEPKFYEKVKVALDKFAYQLLGMFPELTAQSQTQAPVGNTLNTSVVELFATHEEKDNKIRLNLGNKEIDTVSEYKNLTDTNTKTIFGEQKTFFLAENGFEISTDLTKRSHLNLSLFLKDSVIGHKEYENPIELFYDMLTGRELTVANSVNLLAAEQGIAVYKDFEPKFTLPSNIFDAFLGTSKAKEVNSATLDDLPLDGLENYFAELMNVNLTGDSDWLYPPKKYFTDKPILDSFLPNSIKYQITRNVLKNDFGRLDAVFYEQASNNLKKFLYPIFFLKYLLVFEVEFYNTEKDKWETVTETTLSQIKNNLFCRIRRYENKKYIPEELFKKFRKSIEINNKYFVITKEV